MAKINTTDYENTHGRKPRGCGYWLLRSSNCRECFTGNYGEVIKNAKVAARIGGREGDRGSPVKRMLEAATMITNNTIQGDGLYRIFADGWWADVEYKRDRETDTWRVAILDSNAYGRVPLTDIVLAVNETVGMGEVPPDKLVWVDTGGTVL